MFYAWSIAHRSLVSQLIMTRQSEWFPLEGEAIHDVSFAHVISHPNGPHHHLYHSGCLGGISAGCCTPRVFCPLLLVAVILISIEVIVFVASGMKCPLTDLAKKYGAEKGYAFETFLPEALTKYTFRFFGLLLVIGLILLALRMIRL